MNSKRFAFGIGTATLLAVLASTATLAYHPTGPLAYWKLDAAVDSTLVDSAHGNDGTIHGDPTFVAAQVNDGLDFDGSDDYVEVPDTGTVDLDGLVGLTLSAWIKLDGPGSGVCTPTPLPELEPVACGGIISKYNTSSPGFVSYYLSTVTDEVRLFVAKDSGTYAWETTDAANLTAGMWYHVAGTWDGAAFHIYVNGVEQTSTTFIGAGSFPDAMNSSSVPVNIGRFGLASGGNAFGYFDGVIDEAQIYERALSVNEIEILAGISSSLFVDDDGEVGFGDPVNCDGIGVSAYTTIQAAVDAASDGYSITVCDGTYQEQVIVDSFDGLNLSAASNPTIVAPVNAEGSIVLVQDSEDVTIDGFVVDGDDNFAGGCDSGVNRMRGILFRSSTGAITNNIVTRIRHTPADGCQEGNAIEVRNPPFDGTHPNTKWVTVSGNSISEYQKTGIVANGDVNVTVHDNIVTGLGQVNFIAQNGIQLGFGATGNVHANTVSENWYTPVDWVAAGVLLFDANDASVKANSVSGSQVGIATESWCLIAPSASNNSVTLNMINGAQLGVSVHSFTFFSSCNPAADNNKVVNNTISNDAGGDIGVSVGAFDVDIPSAGFDPTADNNKVIHNSITGYATPIETDGATASKVQANVFDP